MFPPLRIGGVSSVAPFAGAWIEIFVMPSNLAKYIVAPFAGAWIEIRVGCGAPVSRVVAPFAGAWIEMLLGFIKTLAR